MAVINHMVDVAEFLTENTRHNYEHNPQQIPEDEATNRFEKLAPKFCEFQSVQPLGCHDNIALLGVETNHWGHTKECYEKVTHFFIEVGYNLSEDTWILKKMHDLK